VGLLWSGLVLCVRSPRLLLLGLIPVLITAAIFLVAIVALLYVIDDLASAVTWFAADWPETPRGLVRLAAGATILGAVVLVAMVSFVAATLLIGEPSYERISEDVEDRCGGAPAAVETGFWRSLPRDLADSARLVSATAIVGICLFCAGLLPVVGQTVVPVLGAVGGGWFLAVELVSVPFARRGLRLRDRWRALRAHRAEALGFGTAVFVCFTFIPGGVVLLMPAAVAGGTLLARHVLGAPHRPRSVW
jgi:CysZ protein